MHAGADWLASTQCFDHIVRAPRCDPRRPLMRWTPHDAACGMLAPDLGGIALIRREMTPHDAEHVPIIIQGAGRQAGALWNWSAGHLVGQCFNPFGTPIAPASEDRAGRQGKQRLMSCFGADAGQSKVVKAARNTRGCSVQVMTTASSAEPRWLRFSP